jgi:hypothetical protein
MIPPRPLATAPSTRIVSLTLDEHDTVLRIRTAQPLSELGKEHLIKVVGKGIVMATDAEVETV